MGKSHNNRTLKNARRKVVLARLEENLRTKQSTRKNKNGFHTVLDENTLERIEGEAKTLRERVF